SLAWRRRVKEAKAKKKRSANPLLHRQIEGGIGLIVSKNMPSKEAKSGSRALPSKSQRRNLSTADQSCSDLLRNATTTPANPASATAIWAATDKASFGCMVLPIIPRSSYVFETDFANARGCRSPASSDLASGYRCRLLVPQSRFLRVGFVVHVAAAQEG